MILFSGNARVSESLDVISYHKKQRAERGTILYSSFSILFDK